MKSPRTWVALFGRSDLSTTGVGGFANLSLKLSGLLALASVLFDYPIGRLA